MLYPPVQRCNRATAIATAPGPRWTRDSSAGFNRETEGNSFREISFSFQGKLFPGADFLSARGLRFPVAKPLLDEGDTDNGRIFYPHGLDLAAPLDRCKGSDAPPRVGETTRPGSIPLLEEETCDP